MKRIPKVLFLIYCLTLTSGLILVYALFSNYFNQNHGSYQEIAYLKAQVENEKFEKTLLSYQLKDFQQTVAEILPHESKGLSQQNQKIAKDFSLILREPSSIPPLDLSSVLYEGIRSQFKEKKFDTVIKKTNELIDKYPSSKYTTEAYFFKAEAYFILKDFKKCIEVIDQMVELFPENNLTGYILLRLGQINELNNQNAEAKEIYLTVSEVFDDPQLKSQAKLLASKLQ